MKNILFFLLLSTFSLSTKATIRRCNHNVTVGVYTTAQAAHDAANAGDTIHLEPSGNYGPLTITKKIILFSTGDFIQQNVGYQASPFVGYCSNITLSNGSEYSIISAKVSEYIIVEVHNISILHTHCPNINLSPLGYPLDQIRIAQSIIDDGVYANYGWTDLILKNNYINHLICYNNSTASYGNFEYNIFGNNVTTISNSTLANNIFLYNVSHSNCVLTNNLSGFGYGNQLPNNNGNINEVDMSTVFQNWNNFNGDNFQLLASCPYQYAGMYAGPSPYTPACTAGIPSIYQLNVPENSIDSTLIFTVSTKSN